MIKKASKKREVKWLAHTSQNEDARINLLCFVFAGGSPAFFATWKAQFPSWINVMPVLYPQREKRMTEMMPETIGELVKGFVRENEKLLKTPYAIWGHCSGALIGLEVVAQTQNLGNSAKAFIVSGSESPEYALVRLQGGEQKRTIADISDEGIIGDLKKFNLMDATMLENETFKKYFLPIYRADLGMLCNYIPPVGTKLSVPALIMNGAEDKMIKSEYIREWEKYFVEDTLFETYTGEHYFINDDIEKIANRITSFLENNM